jgi:hypothetical protein
MAGVGVVAESALPALQVSALLNKARNAVALQIALSLERVECLLTRVEARTDCGQRDEAISKSRVRLNQARRM